MNISERQVLTQELSAFYTEDRCNAMKCFICLAFNYSPVKLDCACKQSLCYGCAQRMNRTCPQCRQRSSGCSRDPVVDALFDDWIYPIKRCLQCGFLRCWCEAVPRRRRFESAPAPPLPPRKKNESKHPRLFVPGKNKKVTNAAKKRWVK